MDTSKPRPRLCNPKPFKEQFRRDTKERKERRYCFILGAGASVASGIPTGSTLASQWLREIYERERPSPEPGRKPLSLEEWCASRDCPVPGINPQKPAAHYPQLFLARYPGGDPEGQRFIQEAIGGTKPNQANLPSVGYAYLALLLQQTDSRVVITTNFDNLAADALLLFTGSLPRVVGHERVANFAGLRDGQPLIAKIHGDVGFVTTNDPAGVSILSTEWHEPLRNIFRDHIPVVIGYDGNDGSLMDFFIKELFEQSPDLRPRSLLRSGLYWCYRAAEGRGWEARIEGNERLKMLTAAHQVHFVPIPNFDLWMMELGEACGVGDPEQILRESVDRRVKTLTEQVTRARAEQLQHATDPAVEASREETREEIGKRHIEWDWIHKARNESDVGKADSYFRKAIEIAPNAPHTLGNYATFLKNQCNDDDRAEEFFQMAVAADPNYAVNLGNYANFLADRRKDYYRADEYYQKAVVADPNHALLLGNYASFLAEELKDYQRADEYFQKAVAVDSNHANNLGNYAAFLHDRLKDSERAAEYYQRAIAADPNHSRNLGNYANFLKAQKKDDDRAEEYYKKATSADPKNAVGLGNYAIFLTNQGKDDDLAEEYFQKAIAANPNDANNLGGYAAFLKNKRKDDDRADEYYQKAVAADPNQANNLCNYAQFLIGRNKLGEAAPFVSLAWTQLSGQNPTTASEVVFSRWLLAAVAGREGQPALGRLKTLMQLGYERYPWSFDEMLAVCVPLMTEDHMKLAPKLAAAILDETKVAELEADPAWQAVKPIPFDTPWPDDPQ